MYVLRPILVFELMVYSQEDALGVRQETNTESTVESDSSSMAKDPDHRHKDKPLV